MTQYFVIATVWSDEKKAQVKEIQGTFTDYICAHIFTEAYNKRYNANAYIVDADELISK